MWDLVSQEERRKLKKSGGIDEYLSPILTVSQYSISARCYLFGAGDIAAPLWDHIDNGMTLSGAVSLLKRARAIAKKNNTPTADPLARLLEDLDSGVQVRKLPGGKIARARPRSSLRSSLPGQAPAPSPDDKKSQTFWDTLRSHIGEHVDSVLSGIDEITSDGLKRSFEADLRVVFDDFQTRLSVAKRSHSIRSVSVSRSKLIDACRTLCLDPPRVGEKIDMNLVNRQRKKLARVYHPDVVGNNATVDQYRSIMDAYQVIQTYTETQ